MAANSTNLADFRRAFHRDVELLLETGLHAVRAPDRSRFEDRIACKAAGISAPPLRLLWSGELHTRKALPVLLRALSRLRPEIAWHLDVLGDGPMQAAWLAESRGLDLGDRVRFLGRQSFTDAVAEMDSADLFCFTSLRDTSGNVVLEALAAGVPVMCFGPPGLRGHRGRNLRCEGTGIRSGAGLRPTGRGRSRSLQCNRSDCWS